MEIKKNGQLTASPRARGLHRSLARVVGDPEVRHVQTEAPLVSLDAAGKFLKNVFLKK